jgi:hypothetical protein
MSLPSIINKNGNNGNNGNNNNDFLKLDSISSSSSSKSTEIPVWFENPNILFQKEYIFEFYPCNTMSYNQKINTISRVIFIITLFLFIFTRNVKVWIVFFITIFFVYLFYKKDFSENNKKRILEEGYDNPAEVYLKKTNHPVPPNTEIFQQPDSKNPFGNVLVPDYEYKPHKKPAPPASNEIINTTILKKAKQLVKEQNPGQPTITDKLFKDLNEELNFEQSLRPFHSMANTTIPNDQAGFADFCYGNTISCKEGNLFACARNTSHYTLY